LRPYKKEAEKGIKETLNHWVVGFDSYTVHHQQSSYGKWFAS